MRTTARSALALAAAAAASSAYAQSSPSGLVSGGLSLLSQNCTSAIVALASNSSLTSCLHVSALAPLLASNTTSIIPTLDAWMSATCGSDPCSNATLSYAADAIVSGCAADLAAYDVPNATVYEVIGAYPLVREIVCLKTVEPETGNSTASYNTTGYNTTNGTFCVTSTLTQLETYLGGNNLSISSVSSLATSPNASAQLSSIPPTALCTDCIFAAVDLVLEEYPSLANYTWGNYTVESFLEGTCAAEGLNITNNGTLPDTIVESAVNSSFGYPVVFGNGTSYTPTTSSAVASSTATGVSARDVTAAKRRWIGQQ